MLNLSIKLLPALEILYKNRFEIFFVTLLGILFGTVIFAYQMFEMFIQPLLFLLNIAAGILLISKKRKLMWFFIFLFAMVAYIYGGQFFKELDHPKFFIVRLFIYFVFYIVVAVEIIQQVWRDSEVNKNVIYGLMSGYISLGLLAFFCFRAIEYIHPGSFHGLSGNEGEINSLLYFSYVTLLTIGYGDISPIDPLSQIVTIITGLSGQFYLVIITAVVIEKYIRHSRQD